MYFLHCCSYWAGRMFTVGLIFGPMLHTWYKYLDRFLPLADISTVLKKVVVDQGVGAPIFLAYFFAGKNFQDMTAHNIYISCAVTYMTL